MQYDAERLMRTTLTIDDDVFAAARAVAERDNKSLGEVVSELARRGLNPPSAKPVSERNGIPLLPQRADARPVTMELVNKLRDDVL